MSNKAQYYGGLKIPNVNDDPRQSVNQIGSKSVNRRSHSNPTQNSEGSGGASNRVAVISGALIGILLVFHGIVLLSYFKRGC